MVDKNVSGEVVVEKIIAKVICPILRRFEEETGESFLGRFFVYGKWGFQFVTLLDGTGRAAAMDASQARGDIRLQITKAEDRPCDFQIEAIFRGIREETGFSGFEVTGEVLIQSGSVNVESDMCVVRYGIWEWQRCR